MDCVSILLLIALGGSCGGVASAIAQNNLNNSYKIRVPFLLDKNTQESRLIPLGILGNIIIGAAASTSIFFVAGSLFNLNTTANHGEKREQPAIFDRSEFINLPEEQATDYAKLFSISVAAGFAGITLMENMARRVTHTVFSEEHRSKEAVIVQKEKEENGKTTDTAMFLSQGESHKAINSASTDIIDLAQKQVKNTDDSGDEISSNEALNQLPTESLKEDFKALNDKSMVGSSK